MKTLLCFLCAAMLTGTSAEQIKVVVEKDVPVPMRDGVVLRGDVCRPDQGGPYPVLLMRTPYGKRHNFDRYVKAGYIVVCQDARGRYASDGTYESFVRFQTHDAEDGYDTVEWAARLPGSNGKVGTFGASYNAFLQWRLAPLQPPSLVAIAAQTIPGRYTDLEGPGTIRPGRRLTWWIKTMAPDMHCRASKTPQVPMEPDSWMSFVPWLELPPELFGDESEAVFDWLRHPHTDPWQLDRGCREITVPNLDIVGWYDHCNGDMLLYRTLAREGKTEAARKGSRIVIGPWGHSTRGKRKFGAIDFGPEAALDLAEVEIRWFDYWLKGQDNGIDREPPVKIFVMGDNRWRGEPEWPLRRAREEVLLLTSGGRANTPAGDGRLVRQSPPPGKDTYVYDPKDPVPSLHGKASFAMVADQRPLADRQDILVYQTEPFSERIEVTGNPVVELYAASSAPDTDWFVRLIDVAPDGLARDVCQGVIRARYRNGIDRPELITPGEVLRYTIRMGATSNAFLPGHRIRLDVTSSDFPNFDRNHNTAADQNADGVLAIARQTIFHGGDHATRLILPRVVDADPAESGGASVPRTP